MELKVSSRKPGFSSSDCTSDPEDKEFSEGEDEDDDRNHKHRRRETRSQSLEGNSLDQGLARPYRKSSRPFENGYSYRDGGPQSGEIWKAYNVGSERGPSSRFERRHPNQASFSRPSELNQRTRGNQIVSSEVGLVRGRGREPIPWGMHDSRFGLVDVASPIVQTGPVPSALFAGRGFPNVSNTQNSSWNAFGLVPGVPNCGLDSLHPLGLPGTMRPAISPSINIGIPLQRCRDFEERGFCLRGDMCPMEHGVNRIVIEDVQGLSQFNLPVSLPGTQLLGTSTGQGALPVISSASGSLANSKPFHSKNNKRDMTDNGFMGASDVYDPDQPLWTNDNTETTAPLLAVNQSNADERSSFMDMHHSDHRNAKSHEGFDDESSIRNASVAGSQRSSMWGRVGSSKHSVVVNDKNDSAGTSSSYAEQNIKNEEVMNAVLPNVPHQGKGTSLDGNGALLKQSLLKAHNDSLRNNHKQSQKALCTLFVNGIPMKDNKRVALLSHFQKFGEVIDIYIPMHSERAFVQFSKREEAEAALKAPDAVMGNRFIKLFWANRDNIPDDGKNGTNGVPLTHHKMTLNPTPSHPCVPDKGKENPHPAIGKDGNACASLPQMSVHDHPMPMVATGPKAHPPQQKKLESLELLKEEIRKKREMLEQKQNEFRRQLDKLQKQAVDSKDVTGSEPAPKRPKGDTPPNLARAETSKPSPRENVISTEKAASAEPAVPPSSILNQTVPVQEPVKPSVRPPAPLGTPFVANRFKLDNRTTAFRIISPLPSGLANVAALKEHFSSYGDISSIELEESEQQGTSDAPIPCNASAHVSFTTRRFAEKAFLHGKCWQGHKLQFVWFTPNHSGKECAGSANISTSSNTLSSSGARPTGEDAYSSFDKVDASGDDAPSPSKKIEDKETDAGDCFEQEKKDSDSSSTSNSREEQVS